MGDTGSITDGVMADARITSVLQWATGSNNSQSSGIMGRAQNSATGNSPGYFVGLYRNTSLSPQYYLIIAKDPSVGSFGSILTQVAFTPTVGTNYLLEATFSGNELTASLYNASGEDQLATLSIADATYESGVFGVRGRANSTDPLRTLLFDNYAIMAIPEPSPVAMLVVAGAVLGVIVSRKKTGVRLKN